MKLLLFFLIIPHVLFSQTAQEHYTKGVEYAKDQKKTLALIEYGLAIEANPYDWHFYNSRAWINYEIKDLQSALKDINNALKLHPKHLNSHSLGIRAKIYLELQQYSEAIEDFTYIINYFNEEFATVIGVTHMDRGKAYLYSKQKQLACIDFRESVKRGMNDSQHFINSFCE